MNARWKFLLIGSMSIMGIARCGLKEKTPRHYYAGLQLPMPWSFVLVIIILYLFIYCNIWQVGLGNGTSTHP